MKFSRMLVLVLMVSIISTIVPETVWAQTKLQTTSSYEEFTPRKQREMEEFYWEILLGRTHVAKKFLQGIDGFILRDEVSIEASIILEEMEPYPGGEPGDTNALQFQRHWGNFFSRIAEGRFSNSELRRNLRRVRRKARKYWHVPLW